MLSRGAYFKVTETKNVKEKVLSFFSFKIKMKQIFTINKPHIIKNLNINNIYFYCLDPSSINILV